MVDTTIQYRFVCRRATEDLWNESNDVLLQGEIGLVLSAADGRPDGRYKVGDGFTPWRDLPWTQIGLIDPTGIQAGSLTYWDPTTGQWKVSEAPINEYRTIGAVFDGGVSLGGAGIPMVAGAMTDVYVGFNCEIVEARIFGGPTGDIVIDVWVCEEVDFPPTAADSIVASAKPQFLGDEKVIDGVLTGWTKTIAAGSYVRFYLEACTDIEHATIQLKVKRTY